MAKRIDFDEPAFFEASSGALAECYIPERDCYRIPMAALEHIGGHEWAVIITREVADAVRWPR